MAQFGIHVDEDLQVLDNKIKQLRNEYEQYFLGGRKREPQMLRQEVTKMVAYYANVPITNTGHRFRFNNLRARFFTLRRYWDLTLRKIDEGRYERHVFKANLRERDRGGERPEAKASGARAAGAESEDLFERYVSAREACGQGVGGLTREKLETLLAEQAAAIRSRFGCQEVRFRVVVEGGKAKVRAKPVKD
jgi:hypothetical protein